MADHSAWLHMEGPPGFTCDASCKLKPRHSVQHDATSFSVRLLFWRCCLACPILPPWYVWRQQSTECMIEAKESWCVCLLSDAVQTGTVAWLKLYTLPPRALEGYLDGIRVAPEAVHVAGCRLS